MGEEDVDELARGKNLFGSVLKETPEIAYDAQRVAAVLPHYKDAVGDGIRVIYIDGEEDLRGYNTSVWRNRLTRFHGVSISEQRAVFAERKGRLKNNPFYTPQGFVVFGQFPVRDTKRVKTDSPLGYIAIDQIQDIIRIEYITDGTFLQTYPDAECAILLHYGTLIPCYMTHSNANTLWDQAVCIRKGLFEQHEQIMQARLNGGKVKGVAKKEVIPEQTCASAQLENQTNELEKKDNEQGKGDPKSQSTLPVPK